MFLCCCGDSTYNRPVKQRGRGRTEAAGYEMVMSETARKAMACKTIPRLGIIPQTIQEGRKITTNCPNKQANPKKPATKVNKHPDSYYIMLKPKYFDPWPKRSKLQFYINPCSPVTWFQMLSEKEIKPKKRTD